MQTYYGLEPTDETEVSLIENDVSILFAGEDRLPPNASVTYDDLFVLDNDVADTSEKFTVTLELAQGNFLEGEFTGSHTVNASHEARLNATVDTDGDSQGDTDQNTLEITIEQA